MNYKFTIFGVKDTTYEIIDFIEKNLCKVDLIVTISEEVLTKSHVAGYKSLRGLADMYNIELLEVDDYSMKDSGTLDFFKKNTFEIGISMGWQRLIPEEILERYQYGVFGFHGSCGYLPYGRGRSPLNWSIINGDSRVIMNLFQYDKDADSPNIYDNIMFEINEFDTIRTVQYKNLLCAKELISRLIKSYQENKILIKKGSKDFDLWYSKRTAADGKIDFKNKTREIYNLIRGVTKPFPGAFAFCNDEKVIIWEAVPFDQMLDFSEYAPGEVVDVFDKCLVVRTVDGSLLVKQYESNICIGKNDILV